MTMLQRILMHWLHYLVLVSILQTVRGDLILPWVPQASRQIHTGCAFESRLRTRCASFRLPNSSSSLPPAFTALNPTDLWVVRMASAGLTYFGFVAFNDRPRGKLMVEPSTLEIKTSLVPNAGLGLFLAQDLPRGTVLGEYPGVVLPLAQHAASNKMQKAPLSEAYIWRFSDNAFVIDPTDQNGVLQPNCRGGNPSTPFSVPIFSTLLSFVTVPSTLCRINEPPKGRDVNVITEEDLRSRTVNFQLERNCYAGEELYIDYGLSYDRSMYGPSE